MEMLSGGASIPLMRFGPSYEAAEDLHALGVIRYLPAPNGHIVRVELVSGEVTRA